MREAVATMASSGRTIPRDPPCQEQCEEKQAQTDQDTARQETIGHRKNSRLRHDGHHGPAGNRQLAVCGELGNTGAVGKRQHARWLVHVAGRQAGEDAGHRIGQADRGVLGAHQDPVLAIKHQRHHVLGHILQDLLAERLQIEWQYHQALLHLRFVPDRLRQHRNPASGQGRQERIGNVKLPGRNSRREPGKAAQLLCARRILQIGAECLALQVARAYRDKFRMQAHETVNQGIAAANVHGLDQRLAGDQRQCAGIVAQTRLQPVGSAIHQNLQLFARQGSIMVTALKQVPDGHQE